MELEDKKIGFAFTGSFCTFDKLLPILNDLKNTGSKIIPIFSEKTQKTDTRYGKAKDIIDKIVDICGEKPILTLTDAEPIGPNKLFDIMIIAPATGNTVAKLANGITDGVVLMAAKAHLRNQRPLVLAVSTNDALGMNAKNIGLLLNTKNIYFVPFRQDDHKNKTNSLVAEYSLIIPTLIEALQNKQIQPLLLGPNS
ncbi:dipicolinate synthase subunit B [Caldicellulosiruptoraceae bacterium PP1]